jgi:hypothetical protein
MSDATMPCAERTTGIRPDHPPTTRPVLALAFRPGHSLASRTQEPCHRRWPMHAECCSEGPEWPHPFVLFRMPDGHWCCIITQSQYIPSHHIYTAHVYGTLACRQKGVGNRSWTARISRSGPLTGRCRASTTPGAPVRQGPVGLRGARAKRRRCAGRAVAAAPGHPKGTG